MLDPEKRERKREYMARYKRRPEVQDRLRIQNAEGHHRTPKQESELRGPELLTFTRLKTYGLTFYDYIDMKVKQNNSCFLCSASFDRKCPHLDHCLKTGVLRGLLCSSCNARLGKYKEDIVKLRSIADRMSEQADLLRRYAVYIETQGKAPIFERKAPMDEGVPPITDDQEIGGLTKLEKLEKTGELGENEA